MEIKTENRLWAEIPPEPPQRQMVRLQNLSQATSDEWALQPERSQTAVSSTNANSGIKIYQVINDAAIDANDNVNFLQVLSDNYGIDYFEEDPVHPDSAHNRKANLVFQQAMLEGIGKKEFEEKLLVFLKSPAGKFATWNSADFFDAVKPAKLYPYSWVLKEIGQRGAAQASMEAYYVRGVAEPLWRYADGTRVGKLFKKYPVDELQIINAFIHFIILLKDFEPQSQEKSEQKRLHEIDGAALDVAKKLSAMYQLEEENNLLKEKIAGLEEQIEVIVSNLYSTGVRPYESISEAKTRWIFENNIERGQREQSSLYRR